MRDIFSVQETRQAALQQSWLGAFALFDIFVIRATVPDSANLHQPHGPSRLVTPKSSNPHLPPAIFKTPNCPAERALKTFVRRA
jgi:hypothetical protein